ncbi:sulfotransferase 6B1-like isoform X4 [Branchiostoma floridae x Branchiostoma japonicum]
MEKGRSKESMASSQQHPRSKAPPYVKHQGILFSTARVSRETLKAMKTFEIRDDDVVIVSYPKSGMNWMFEVVHKILVRKENSSPIAPEMWPPDKEQPNYIQLRDSPSPRLMFTHLQPKMAPPGLAAPVNKTPESWEQHNKDFLLGKMPFGDYFDHVLGWWQMRNDPHFLFVKYEDMKKDFRSSVKTIAAFLEKELTDEHLALILNSCSLESMRKTLAESGTWRKNVVRNGMVGDWKNHFSAEESARFDQKYRERMAGTGLEFEFE